LLSRSEGRIVPAATICRPLKFYPLKLSLDQEISEEAAAEAVAVDAVESTRQVILSKEMSRSPLRSKERSLLC